MDVLPSLRHLTSFSPARVMPGPVPWAALAELAILHGVAPLVAYNVEFRMGGARAPQDVRDRLLGMYQGTLADNVFKLVNLKKLLTEADTVPAVLLEAACYSDALYPHIAFRPVPEIRLLVRREDVPVLVAAGKPLGMKPGPEESGAFFLSDGRTKFLLHTQLFAAQSETLVDDILRRGMPAKAFGPMARRPSIEDALVTHLGLIAMGGFDVPLIDFVDLRELVLGSPSQGGTWSKPPDATLVKQRAEALGVSRALYAAMAVLAKFYPDVAAQAQAYAPELSLPVRALLEKLVVEPTLNLERAQVSRGGEQVRKLLTGG